MKKKKKNCWDGFIWHQFRTIAQLCPTLCNPIDCSTPDFPTITNTRAYSNSCTSCWWCHSTISSSALPFSSRLQSFPASGSFLMSHFFTSGSQNLRLSFSINSSSEYSGLISFRMDWLDVLAVQGTLKSLLQHYSSEASILWCSGFFLVQLSHPYMTTGKTIALTRQNFVGKVTSLLLNMPSSLVITFLPRSKCLLISCCSHRLQWFWSPKK